ncbi:MAG TPA: hypothetical protein VGW80_07735 [Solirubrobacterales bacterium]|jgi:hypothetical protein|nr:hypothetical protein [Solirubrobacterales bacterium]
MRVSIRPLLTLLWLLPLLIAGCGSSSGESSRPAPSAAEFPAAKGKTITDLLRDSGAKPTKLVIAPAAQVFDVGENRYPFGVFTAGNEQVDDADVALYFAKDEKKGAVVGPLPAQVTSLEVKSAYRAAGEDPDQAKNVYVVPNVDFDRKGPWVAIAMLKGEAGLEASRVPSPVVSDNAVPQVGEKAPLIHTPTAEEVGGDLAKIDTRVPHDQMHEVDFADVLGKEPIVLVFATPALCQSRVCGPVVDVAQQVADEYKGRADFIHMEVYVDNDIAKGIRPQLQTYHLPTEPWTFLIDRKGIIRDRIEGAYGVPELEAAMRSIVP